MDQIPASGDFETLESMLAEIYASLVNLESRVQALLQDTSSNSELFENS